MVSRDYLRLRRCFFLLRFPLTQQVFYSSQVAPRALHVRVHFNGLVEESLRRLQVPRRARLVLEPPVMVGHNRLARRLGLLCARLRLLPPGRSCAESAPRLARPNRGGAASSGNLLAAFWVARWLPLWCGEQADPVTNRLGEAGVVTNRLWPHQDGTFDMRLHSSRCTSPEPLRAPKWPRRLRSSTAAQSARLSSCLPSRK